MVVARNLVNILQRPIVVQRTNQESIGLNKFPRVLRKNALVEFSANSLVGTFREDLLIVIILNEVTKDLKN